MAAQTIKPCLQCGKHPRKLRQNFCGDECRFWHKVDRRGPGDCWLWLGTTPAFGHGQFVFRGRRVYAHRYAWEMLHGPLPADDDICVLHKCDIPSCVNPAHLFIGTRSDNLTDMRKKGRGSKPPTRFGSKHHAATATEEIVKAIRASERVPDRVLAERYGISRRAVCSIRLGHTWTHVR